MEPISAVSGAILTWVWEKYGARVLAGASDVAKEEWTRINWAASAERYKKRMFADHSTTKLLGNPKEIRLDQIYTDVYVLDQVSAFRRLEVEQLEKEQRKRVERGAIGRRVSLLSTIQAASRVYVIGKPGAGKSTFLKTVVRLSCEGAIAETAIFVPLKRWSDGEKSLEQFIVDEFSICNFPEAQLFVRELLLDGGAIVLFDGLDEVSNVGTKRRDAINSLTQFSRKYPLSKIVLTCRTAATEYSFDKFTYVEIADFDPDQQVAFISRWYSDRPESRDRLLSEWHREESDDLVDLARTPLLLALLCLAYDETLIFPRRRVELYEESVNALLRKWDSSREISRDEIYRGLSHNRKEQMLRRIAFASFTKGELFIKQNRLTQLITAYLEELPPEDVSQGIDGDIVLRAMEAQHGLVIERAHGIYSFSHLTIHEYFVAKKVVESTKSDEIVSLMTTHAADDQWREVILMVASLLDDGRFLIDAFMDILRTGASNPKVRSFASAALSIRRGAAPRIGRYGSGHPINATRFDANAMLVLDCCAAVAGNLTMLGVEERYRTLPRLIASALHESPDLIHTHFQLDVEALRSLKEYFRLVVLVSECLGLTALPDRKSYLHSLFEPLEP